MENREYFILVGKEKQGPYTIDTLKQTGIDPTTKIWHAGLSKWTKASELPELHEFLPSASSHRRKRLWVVAAVIILAGGALGATKLFSRPKTIVMAQRSSLSNQQLYKLYAPSVVLIQHRYMYRITAGEKKFYFDDFYAYDDDAGYLRGLTEDSSTAADQAQLIQGTGFFISRDGKILTNRHVAKATPTAEEQLMIRNYFIRSLEGALSSVNFSDSVRRKKEQNDSLLAVLLMDSAANTGLIADVKEKISNAEDFLSEDADYDELKTDSATVDYLRNQSMRVEKITLELSVFSEGTSEITAYNGTRCKVIATSDDENVDLALLQTNSGTLPAMVAKTLDLSRIANIYYDEGLLPQMSERLILIGYNRGIDLAQTTEGIQAQLTDGKVSQNTDAFKLMYTIPTLPGSSGSPVMDDKGRLVSVNFAGMTETQSFNYGIQPGQIKSFLQVHEILPNQ
jgi:S1-C subfamily serine protease